MNRMNTQISNLLFSFLGLFVISTTSSAQKVYGNEWIDYNKTYFSFEVAPAGAIPSRTTEPYAGTHVNYGDYKMLHRIPYATLAANGLAGTPVEQFQLWRNGQQIAIYTVPSSGVMDSNGYLEFWGDFNDGYSDTALFRKPEFQLNKRWSVISDTAKFFLTVNPAGNNLRIVQEANGAATSTLTPTTQIWHTVKISPRAALSSGRASLVGSTPIASSSFELGEGYGIGAGINATRNFQLPNLNAAPTGSANLKVVYLSGQFTTVNSSLLLNGETLTSQSTFGRRSDSLVVTGIDQQKLVSIATPIVGIYNTSSNPNNPTTIYSVELEYLRNLQFQGDLSSFQFSLPASQTAILLKFTNFNTRAYEKILIDRTNNKRYSAVVQGTDLLFELPASAISREFILTTINPEGTRATVRSVNTLQRKQFTSFAGSSRQGDYLIISNQRLMDDMTAGSNQVEAYRSYRNSAAGGSYNAAIYEINDLVDQFGYGIHMNPLSIRHFIHYAMDRFSATPKAVLLIGRGVTYNLALRNALARDLNFVPTWGDPASDNLLASPNNQEIAPMLPIGRIAAIDGLEIQSYLKKVKDFEQVQKDPNASKAFQKESIFLIGALDTYSYNQVSTYMQMYEESVEGPKLGGEGYIFSKVNNPNTSEETQQLNALIADGTSLITYFGHSSPTSIDFNINTPSELAMPKGKLPVFIANGCSAAQIFDLNANRLNKNNLTIGEKFIFTPEKGSAAFISTTHLGILNNLHNYTLPFMENMADTLYGRSIGEIHNEALRHMQKLRGVEELNTRLTAEQIHLHGDPVIRMHTVSTPDYYVEKIEITPEQPSINTDSLTIRIVMNNAGLVINDSVLVRVSHLNPQGQTIVLREWYEKELYSSRNIALQLPVQGLSFAGTHGIRVEVDFNNAIAESNETNNSLQVSFTVEKNIAGPVYPANYSIINSWPQKLYGYSAGAQDTTVKTWRLEMDTTTFFNSPAKYTEVVESRAGNIEFSPANALRAGTVYYWRIVSTEGGETVNSEAYSFTYLPGEQPGFNQQHLYQHLAADLENISLDSTSRTWAFEDRYNNIFINHGIYPMSGVEAGHFSISANSQQINGGACVGRSIIFNVFDPISFEPWSNNGGQYGSAVPCDGNNRYNFEYPYFPATNRKKIMDFLDGLPDGVIVVARLVLDPDPGQPAFPEGRTDSATAEAWKKDELIFGTGQSLYHKLVEKGFYNLDELSYTRTFGLVFVNNDSSEFKPMARMSDGKWDRLVFGVDIPGQDTSGTVTSPFIGPAASWNEIHWTGKNITEPNGLVTDQVYVQVSGQTADGQIVPLFRLNSNQQDVQLTGDYAIDAATYPYLQLALHSADTSNGTPFPLDYLRVQYQPVPEGTLTPESTLVFKAPAAGETMPVFVAGIDNLELSVEFKNISNIPFPAALPVAARLEDLNGNRVALLESTMPVLNPGETATIQFSTPVTNEMTGVQNLVLFVNEGMTVKEHSLRNNQLFLNVQVDAPTATGGYKNFYGEGNWSDPTKWTPAGVPQCADKVIIWGKAVVDISNAVSDTLIIKPNASLRLNSTDSRLNIGCGQNGGDKMMILQGNLMMNSGTIQVNGGIQVVSGATFSQTGGDIYIDPTNTLAGNSLQIAAWGATAPQQPVAAFAIGGQSTQANSLYAPFTSGTIEFDGGNLHLVEPAFAADRLTMFYSAGVNTTVTADSLHHLIAGSTNASVVNNGLTNPFLLRSVNTSAGLPMISGSMIGRTGVLNERLVIFDSPEPFEWWFKGRMLLETGTHVRVRGTNKIRIGE